jgi:hypothetical protein
MFYVFVLITVLITLLIVVAGFYYWKRFSLSRQFLDRATMRSQYRFHQLENDGSADQSKDGALLFSVKRISLDTSSVVIKELKINHAAIHVNLDHLMTIAFPAQSNQAYESSVRFRIRGPLRHSNFMNDHHLTIIGYIISESAGRIPFRIQVPISEFIEESEQVRG